MLIEYSMYLEATGGGTSYEDFLKLPYWVVDGVIYIYSTKNKAKNGTK